jgi:pimeloyl-ACP methyl ester carboxylesterase
MTKTLVFSHANSYPAGCYRVLFERWRAAGWRVHALDRFGHDPRFPVTADWRKLRDQLLDFIDTDVKPQGQVALVGHSLGGMLSLMAACRRPDLVNRLVMLDSPVVAGIKAAAIAMAKTTGLIHRYGPSKIARERRHVWPDREAVHKHFAAKKIFARWDPRVLADYIEAGFEEGEDGQVRLRFTREVEAHIYRTCRCSCACARRNARWPSSAARARWNCARRVLPPRRSWPAKTGAGWRAATSSLSRNRR